MTNITGLLPSSQARPTPHCHPHILAMGAACGGSTGWHCARRVVSQSRTDGLTERSSTVGRKL